MVQHKQPSHSWSSPHHLCLNNHTVVVDLSDDFYGEDFWNNFSSRLYEPDTRSLVEAFCNETSIFLDIGAAFGAFTLLALTQGSLVRSYEPNPIAFRALKKNVELNPGLLPNVELFHAAVSDVEQLFQGRGDSVANVLSEIVFSMWSEDAPIRVLSLADVLRDVKKQHPSKRVVIKIDIEGAEFRMLMNQVSLKALQQSEAVIILALHPGMTHPIGNGILQRISWRTRTLFEVWNFYRVYCNAGILLRTNLQPIGKWIKFLALVAGGNFEFVLDFRKRNNPK